MVLPIMSVRWHPGHPHRNPSDRIYDVSCNIRPSRINASIRCEVGDEWRCRRRRTAVTLAEVEPHRSRSRGAETQTAVRTGERRFTNLQSTATTTLRRDRGLVNERVSTAERTTVGPRTLGRIGGVLEQGRGGRSRNGTWRTRAKVGPHRVQRTGFRTGDVPRVNQNRGLLQHEMSDELMRQNEGNKTHSGPAGSVATCHEPPSLSNRGRRLLVDVYRDTRAIRTIGVTLGARRRHPRPGDDQTRWERWVIFVGGRSKPGNRSWSIQWVLNHSRTRRIRKRVHIVRLRLGWGTGFNDPDSGSLGRRSLHRLRHGQSRT